ncbi:MAG: DUF1674 domain-containing protein [Acetobacteraceae bacterium]|nr:DUF1674 domain-containing protein [Acetobacteraceae bacterium]
MTMPLQNDDPGQSGAESVDANRPAAPPPRPKETGGPKGPEPTRYGDWERNGRCVDF